MSIKTLVTRRTFIKQSAAVGAAIAGAGLLGNSFSPTCAAAVPAKWDQEADVVIVGYGGAGAAAALAAHDAGAKVLILEKMPRGFEGGNSAVNGGIFRTPDDLESHLKYVRAMGGMHAIPEDLLRVAAEEAVKNADWVKSFGVDIMISMQGSGCAAAEFPDLPGAKAEKGSNVKKANGGMGMGNDFFQMVFKPQIEEKRKIEILFETPGKELIVNDKGEVVGVLAENGGKPVAVKAKRAVVLATGGFELNDTMQRDYLVQGLETTPSIAPFGTPANTGDGIKMALSVGAELWHMVNQAGPYLGIVVPEYKTALWTSFTGNNYIIVDRHGQRWFNEKESWPHGKGGEKLFFYDPQLTEYPRVPSYIVFDETMRKAGPLSPTVSASWMVLREGVKWSRDNVTEIEKGWVSKADTVEALAAKIKVDPAVLSATVKQYNGFCDKKEDLAHARPKETLAPIATAPFYAVKLLPALLNTQGGPKRNSKSQVMRVDGNPVPRLYAAGELGSIYGFLYNCGGNFGVDCMVFGRIAGRQAAALKPWDAT